VGNEIVNQNPSSIIQRRYHLAVIQDKIAYDTKLTSPLVSSVDWPGIEKALQTVSRPARVKYAKLMYEVNQTNYLNN